MSRLARRALETCRPQTVVTGEVVLGSASVSGTINWTVPAGVYSVSILMVDGGSGGGGGQTGTSSTVGSGGSGGVGARGKYRNDYGVTPGDTLTFSVGPGGSPRIYGWGQDTLTPPTSMVGVTSGWSFLNVSQSSAGIGTPGQQAYIGGTGGYGNSGRSLSAPESPQSPLNNGAAGTGGGSARGGKGGDGGWPGGAGGGGGGGTRLDGSLGGAGGNGANGAVRIIWPGHTRSFPDNAA